MPRGSCVDLEDLQQRRWETLGRLLGFGWIAFHTRVVEKISNKGFTDLKEHHFRLVRSMDYSGTRIVDLAARAGVSKQAMSLLVNNMIEMGYLKKRGDPSDARAYIVTYTSKGLRLAHAIVDAADEVEAEIQSVVGKKTLSHLRQSLIDFLDGAMPEHRTGWSGAGYDNK